ncbi:bifunctional oligoribonuclease/PAP phosphatase NrnA [Sulfurovum sp.]|uniref:DHH family phosphoesterase n=1 Tax=Sulfurovum sp. TaxID=1969726 RepID=UPI0025F375C6|nr:bifunctional oligoribonuclease/PAP phosphatase NrnA [Sulfurovum sp.]
MTEQRFPVRKVKEQLAHAKNITILTHLNPDADTIGTGLGIFNLLKHDRTKRVEIVNASNLLPQHLDFLPSFEKIKHKMDFEEGLVITCDSGSANRLGFDLKGREVLNIDHHESNEYYGTVNVVIAEYASASQVAFELFKTLYPVNEESATCFYAALLSDTRYFTTSSVNQEVFEVAKELVATGVDPAKVACHFTQRRPLSSLRILEKALSHLELSSEGRVATLKVTQDEIIATGARMPDMEGIVDYARSLATVEIGMFAMELADGSIRVSLRSKHVDVSRVAAAFGGGGHKVAAGFTLKQTGLQETIDTILKKIEELGILNEA